MSLLPWSSKQHNIVFFGRNKIAWDECVEDTVQTIRALKFQMVISISSARDAHTVESLWKHLVCDVLAVVLFLEQKQEEKNSDNFSFNFFKSENFYLVFNNYGKILFSSNLIFELM